MFTLGDSFVTESDTNDMLRKRRSIITSTNTGRQDTSEPHTSQAQLNYSINSQTQPHVSNNSQHANTPVREVTFPKGKYDVYNWYPIDGYRAK